MTIGSILNDFAWLKYPLVAAILLVILALIGLGPTVLARRAIPGSALAFAPIAGFAWVIVLISMYANLGHALPSAAVYGVLFASVAIAVAVWAREPGLTEIGRSLRDASRLREGGFEIALPWILGLGLATVFLLPAISSKFNTPGFLTVFTLGNADIGSYIGQASNVVRAGFDNAGLYYDWDPGRSPSTLAANADHTGVSAFLAFSASVNFTDDVWKVTQPAMMAAFAGLFSSGFLLARALLPEDRVAAFALGFLGTATIFVWYLFGNVFIAHLMCLGLVLAQLAVVVRNADRLLSPAPISLLAPLAAATWLTSPEIELIALALSAGFLVALQLGRLVERKKLAVGTLARSIAAVVISVALAIVLVLPAMQAAIDRSKRVYDNQGSVGWSLNLTDGFMQLLGYPSDLGQVSAGLGTVAALAIAIALLAALGLAVRRRERVAMAAGLVCIFMSLLAAFGAYRWGWDTYQSWKLAMTLSVPFLIFGGYLAITRCNPQSRRVVLAIFIAIGVVNTANGARQWHQAEADLTAADFEAHAVPNRLATFLRSEPVQRQRQVNIFLPSMYATMIAPAIYERRAAMSSPSYYTAAQPGPSPFSCSVVDPALYKRKLGRIVYRANGYYLVAKGRCL